MQKGEELIMEYFILRSQREMFKELKLFIWRILSRFKTLTRLIAEIFLMVELTRSLFFKI